MAFVRCKGPDGAEFTIDEDAAASMGQGVTVLTKPAVDGNGRPLPPKNNIHKGGTAKAANSQKDG